jgi:membrane-associated PAP2 superfamily phosphatase
VRARNHLRSTTFVTGFVTHLLLGVAIMSSVVTSFSRDQILAATVFYIVGAMMGLFSRIYRESLTSTAVDDYGLSLARLIATPLLSGLAGVGGVLLFSTFVFESITFPTSNIFRLDRPDYIIAAAFFGLAPYLIIRSLQQRSEKYISALKSSKGAVEETSDN